MSGLWRDCVCSGGEELCQTADGWLLSDLSDWISGPEEFTKYSTFQLNSPKSKITLPYTQKLMKSNFSFLTTRFYKTLYFELCYNVKPIGKVGKVKCARFLSLMNVFFPALFQ